MNTRWLRCTRAVRYRSWYPVVQFKISVAASAASRPGRYGGESVSPERAIGGVRPDHRHIGHAVANLKAAHAIAELIDFPNDVIADHERRPAVHSLRIEVAPDQHVGVLHARGEHADPRLA